MYNFLVTSQVGAWDAGTYSFEKSRFLEYTNDDVAAAFKILTPTHIESLKKYPCLFAYEGKIHEMRIGTLTDIAESSGKIDLKFEFVPAEPITFAEIERAITSLDIRRWELNRTHWAIKNVDLYSVFSQAGISIRPLFGRSSITPDSGSVFQGGQLPTLAAPDFSANSVGQFITHVLGLTRGIEDAEVFYRGHSDRRKYKLVPSLFRQDRSGNYLYLHREDLLFRELLVSNFVDFGTDEYTLDKLVRMQHYSLPTRLLDITSNPLIALYFACKSKDTIEGEVILFVIKRNNIKYFDSDTVSCLANLARLPQAEKEQIEWSGDSAKFNRQQPIRRLLHFIKGEKPYFEDRIISDHLRSVVCVKGKRTNSRISSQVGAFLLYGAEAVLDEEGNENIAVRRVAVTNKVEILKELDLLNINESTVFPYIENSAKYIADKYQIRNS
ncbi:FRG domain-containing protein [Herbaspirillum rubrisubalbicans]|uniref:FRG domain-containing protein n=1 Tax=Herbaspirillum rubrisubalbicans TaxID=80842 RepID=A0ABX9BUP0_9BURK|nr:FRG domain-containing protein [Herbaspirillum rubrisubalbicans]RAM61476.1 FRG domain-containing protein [Herbaspirillum rubrisubalbicans]